MPATRCRTATVLCHASLAVFLAASDAAVSDVPNVTNRPVEVRSEPTPKTPVTGPRLRQALDSQVAGLAWRNVPLRDALHDVGAAFSVSIVRDRRVDPTTPVDVQAAEVPLQEVLDEVASRSGAETRFVGNVAYLAPPEAAAVLRTLVELRRSELEARPDPERAKRRVELMRGQTVRWGDLTEPAEVLRLVNDRFGLAVENAEAVPHDLWSGAVLPAVSAPEALTLVLIQFDLTFTWSDDLTSIRLVPLPERSEIKIERRHAARGPAAATVAAWRERFPDLAMTTDGGGILVRGTVEAHEDLERDRSNRSTPSRRPASDAPEVVPLANRRFTLSVARIPASAVIAKLKESGITFEYDEKELAAAGVDLATPATFDVRQADSSTFFEAVFGPLGLGYEVSGNVVRLKPRGVPEPDGSK